MKPRIFLASRSPRRRQLLHQIGIAHNILEVGLDERPLPGELAADHVVRLAISKAKAGLGRRPPSSDLPILAADTAVAVEGEILGKPASREESLGMMRRLAGRSHQVLTGVALASSSSLEARLSTSQVTFRPVSRLEAEAYWDTQEPCDKAGGYAIQGLGAVFISDLKGSYSGVMGLPLFETAELLRRAGIEPMGPVDRTVCTL